MDEPVICIRPRIVFGQIEKDVHEERHAMVIRL